MLYPHQFNCRGLDDPDFDKEVSKEELSVLLQNSTHQIPDDEFDVMYELTLRNYQRVTFKAFLEMIRNLKRDYLKYRTLFK